MQVNQVPCEAAADEIPDVELVQRACRRDLRAYEELVCRYQGRIYALVYNMTSNREDAQDVTQETFVRAYRCLKSFRGTARFYTWLYRVAVNQTINFIKKRQRKAALSLDDMDAGVERTTAYLELSARESPGRDAAIHELQEKLNSALLQLSEKHRVAVVLHDVQGLSHEEIGKILSCSPGTVRSRLFYARQQLQGILGEYTK